MDYYLPEADLFVPHGVENTKKYKKLIKSMRKDGWVGKPLVVFSCCHNNDCTNYRTDRYAVTGTHRANAAVATGTEIPTISLQQVFEEDAADWDAAIEDFWADPIRTWLDVYIRLEEMLEYLSYEIMITYGLDLGGHVIADDVDAWML